MGWVAANESGWCRAIRVSGRRSVYFVQQWWLFCFLKYSWCLGVVLSRRSGGHSMQHWWLLSLGYAWWWFVELESSWLMQYGTYFSRV